MPKSAPAKVAVSPKATNNVSWICPCGSIKTPKNNNVSPPIERTNAVMSCVFGFIYQNVSLLVFLLGFLNRNQECFRHHEIVNEAIWEFTHK